ncbi:hypothetical protein ACHHYP_03326 [Achlya hypogyna]|uniref:Uncharacterized protein n=1 Tax=Achlya hypogyna TaxID=1202772 RepID=A0A1V9Z3Y2_ACHHY|nr:hypothetical protein ACHHYP_03326 [Achlya hypogyna]
MTFPTHDHAYSTYPLSYEHRCKYAFKRCPNLRSAKRNGQLHSYCEFHRRRANTTQKTYAHKKKVAMVLLDHSTPTGLRGWAPAPWASLYAFDPLPYDTRPDTTVLSWDELEFVLNVLSV